MNFTIHGYSTAMFSTFYMVEELNLLFDAGDGIMSHLMSKSRKARNVFISHADRDHLSGIYQFNQLNAREGLPRYYFPSDCGSFPFMQEFFGKFDPHVSGAQWTPVEELQEISLGKGRYVTPIRNEHVVNAGEKTKSLSYKVFQKKQKLKPQFANLSGPEIGKLRQEQGEDAIMDTVPVNLISYSGDTPVERDGRWNGSEVLIHEATFIHKAEIAINKGNRHSTLEDVIEMVAESDVKTLIVGHFSTRYSTEFIDKHIRQFCQEYRLQIPVFRVRPGKMERDILGGNPVNA